MRIELNKDKRYSLKEHELFSKLPISTKEKGGITSTELAKKMYKHDEFHARAIIVGLIKSLQMKTKKYKEPFKIIKTERRGPYPLEVWIERK